MTEALLKCNPFLTTLEFFEDQYPELLKPLVLACPNLQELWIWVASSPRTAKKILDCLPESIQTVSMRVDSTVGESPFITPLEIQEDPVQQALTATPRSHPNLESLWIVGNFFNDAEDLLLPFLEDVWQKAQGLQNSRHGLFPLRDARDSIDQGWSIHAETHPLAIDAKARLI